MIKEYLGNDYYKIHFTDGNNVATLSVDNITEIIDNGNSFKEIDEVILFDEDKHIDISYAVDYVIENTDNLVIYGDDKNDIIEDLEKIKKITKSNKIISLVDKVLESME